MANVRRSERAYRSPIREEAARRTPAAVVEAAAEVFVEQGYTSATSDQIATRAGVSRATVFGVGNKARLFTLAYQDATTDGNLTVKDDHFDTLLAIADPHRLLEEFAAFTAAMSRRLGPLQLVLEHAAQTDPELAQLLKSSQQDALTCARSVVAAVEATGSLRHDLSRRDCADVLWLQIQPTNYRRLVTERGWSHRAFERWHAAAMISALLKPSWKQSPEPPTAAPPTA